MDWGISVYENWFYAKLVHKIDALPLIFFLHFFVKDLQVMPFRSFAVDLPAIIDVHVDLIIILELAESHEPDFHFWCELDSVDPVTEDIIVSGIFVDSPPSDGFRKTYTSTFTYYQSKFITIFDTSSGKRLFQFVLLKHGLTVN